ncbi:MAG: tRNA (N6-threonylcarbamoyladenosine(37)-N6)-methyltransferase TrmO [Mesorhizobium sp.]
MAQAVKNSQIREGERRFAIDPSDLPADAGVVFIGRVTSPWTSRETCPKNMAAAAEAAQPASVTIDLAFREALVGLSGYSHVILLSWFDRSDRDLAIQKPRHAQEPRGTFALRSPVRPNPIGLHVVRVLGVDVASGRIQLEGIDLLDGTPILDVKPYFASTDSVPDATRTDET